MRIPERWRQVVLTKLTQFWVWVYYRSAIEQETVRTWSGEQNVYWFSSNSDFRGQAIPVIDTIILNDQKLADCNADELKFVVEHEIGHITRNSVAKGIFYGLVLGWIPLGSLLLAKTLGYSLLIPFGLPIEPVAALAGASLFMIFMGLGAWRAEEILADFHVLRYISYGKYLSTYDEMRDREKRSIPTKSLLNLVYTNPETIVCLHRTIERTRNRILSI